MPGGVQGSKSYSDANMDNDPSRRSGNPFGSYSYGSYGSFYQQPFDYHPNFQNQGFCWQAPSNPNFQNQYDYAQYPPSAPVTSASQVNARHSQGSAQAAPASSATSSSTQASSTGSVNCSRVRWTEKETDALMSAWLEIHRDLKEHNKLKKNAVVWQQVTKEYNASAAVNKLNQKTVDQIKIKFRKLLDEYKETKVKMNRTGGASTTCPYFEEFDEIYGTKDSIVPRKISEAGLTLKENKDCNTEKLEWPCVAEDDLVSLASFGSTGSQTDDDISLSQAVLNREKLNKPIPLSEASPDDTDDDNADPVTSLVRPFKKAADESNRESPRKKQRKRGKLRMKAPKRPHADTPNETNDLIATCQEKQIKLFNDFLAEERHARKEQNDLLMNMFKGLCDTIAKCKQN